MIRYLRRWPPFGIVGIQLPGWLCKIIGHEYEFKGWGIFGRVGQQLGSVNVRGAVVMVESEP